MQVSVVVIVAVGVLVNVHWALGATVPLDYWRNGKFSVMELQPNGSLSVGNLNLNGTAKPRAVVVIVRRDNLLRGPFDKWMIKIYGDGVEYKFPEFLERFVQRVQSYFSIYKSTERPHYDIVVAAETINHSDATTTTNGVAATSTFSEAYTDEDYPEFIAIAEGPANGHS